MRGSAHTNSINLKEDGMSMEKNVMSDAVANVMTRDLHCVTPETSIMNAALRMRLADVGAVLVNAGGSLTFATTIEKFCCTSAPVPSETRSATLCVPT